MSNSSPTGGSRSRLFTTPLSSGASQARDGEPEPSEIESPADMAQELDRLRQLLQNERIELRKERRRRAACEAELELMRQEAHGSALCTAAAANDTTSLRKLAKSRQVDQGEYDKRTPLHIAASSGCREAVQCLVDELGAKLSPLDRWQNTPLDDAIQGGHTELVQLLLAKNASHGPGFATRNASAVRAAAAAGDMATLQRLAPYADSVRTPNYEGRTPMHLAASSGYLEAIKLFVEELGAEHSPLDKWGNTPLDAAMRQAHSGVISYLQSKDASQGKTDGPSFAARNSSDFRAASAAGDVAEMRRLASFVDVNLPNYEQRSPLHLAASDGCLGAVKLLVEELGATLSPTDKWGDTPLDAAMRQAHSDVISYLQSKDASQGKTDGPSFAAQNASNFRAASAAGDVAEMRRLASFVDVNVPNYEQRSPLHLAASDGCLGAVKLLVEELGADLSPMDKWGDTPLDAAMRQAHSGVIDYLQSKDASQGKTDGPSFAARNASNFRAASAAGDVAEMRRLASVVDVNVPNYEQRSPLHLAASDGCLEAVKLLVEELGADLSPTDKWGNTPLDAAMRQAHGEVISYLQSKDASQGKTDGPSFAARNASNFRAASAAGDVAEMRRLASVVDVNVPNYEQRSPLHLAASDGCIEAIKLLVELGARVSPTDKWGNTPLDAAMQQGHRDVASYLEARGGYRGASFQQLKLQELEGLPEPSAQQMLAVPAVPLSLGEQADNFAQFVNKGLVALSGEFLLEIHGKQGGARWEAVKPAGTAGCLEPPFSAACTLPGAEPDDSGGAVAKTNQDSSYIANPVGGNANAAIFCVFDGHGRHGHIVSQEVLRSSHFELERSTELLESDPSAALTAAFESVQAHLRLLAADQTNESESVLARVLAADQTNESESVPARESGACAIMAYLTADVLVVAGAGDCRAVLGTQRDGEVVAVDLSTDHKVDSPGEQDRIEATGSFVAPSVDDGGGFCPARVYEYEDQRFRGPGLTMSRVLGDTDAERCGLIPTPEVRTHKHGPEDRFMIIASDGIWEFIDSSEAVRIVDMAYRAGKAASEAAGSLILRAALRWAQNEGNYRDDITATVVYLPKAVAALRPAPHRRRHSIADVPSSSLRASISPVPETATDSKEA